MTLKLPDDMSFEVRAGMPLRTATSAMALFHSLQLLSSLLEKPAPEPVDVLVCGGATSRAPWRSSDSNAVVYALSQPARRAISVSSACTAPTSA